MLPSEGQKKTEALSTLPTACGFLQDSKGEHLSLGQESLPSLKFSKHFQPPSIPALWVELCLGTSYCLVVCCLPPHTIPVTSHSSSYTASTYNILDSPKQICEAMLNEELPE